VRPHLYQAQNIKLCALEVNPSMNATFPPELYYRLSPRASVSLNCDSEISSSTRPRATLPSGTSSELQPLLILAASLPTPFPQSTRLVMSRALRPGRGADVRPRRRRRRTARGPGCRTPADRRARVATRRGRCRARLRGARGRSRRIHRSRNFVRARAGPQPGRSPGGTAPPWRRRRTTPSRRFAVARPKSVDVAARP